MLKLAFLLDRRQFLKVAGVTAGLAVTGSGTALANRLPQRRAALAPSNMRSPLPTSSPAAEKVRTTCQMCANSCNVTAIVETVAGEKLVRRIEPGSPDTPQSKGGVCPKGQAGVQLLYDPDRLKWPVRKNTAGHWERLSWPEALTAVAAGLNKIRTDYGTIANSNGGSNLVQFLFRRMGGGGTFYTQFMNEYGSINQIGAPPICDGAKAVGFFLGMGGSGRLMRDQANATYTLLVGRSEFEAPRFRLAACREIAEMQKDGGKLAVIDPRFTYTASKADRWIGIRPGTDLLLLLTLCRIILDHSLTAGAMVPGAAIEWVADPWADSAYIAARTENLALLRDELYKSGSPYTAANAATVCGVPAADITALAAEFAGREGGGARKANHRPVADTTSGLARWSHAEDTTWALLCLNALMGSICTSGGMILPRGATLNSWSFTGAGTTGGTRLHQQAGWPQTAMIPNGGGMRTLIPFAVLNGLPASHPDHRKVPGPNNSGRDVYAGRKAGERADRPHGIRGLFFCHTDPLIADADTNLWERALRHLQFACSVDLYINSTAEACPPGTVVLPECTYLERTVVGTPSVTEVPAVWAQVKAVEPLHESRSLHNIMVSLAATMSANHGVSGTTGWFAKEAPAADYATFTGRLHKLDPGRDEDFAARIASGTFTALPGGYPMTWADVKVAGGAWPSAADQTAHYPRRVGSAIRGDAIADHGGSFIAGITAGRFSFAHAGSQANVNVAAYRTNRGLAGDAALVPAWRNPRVMPDATYPLRYFPGGRVMWHQMAATVNLPYLMQRFDRLSETGPDGALLFMNPADATPRGIVTGSWVIVASPAGRVRVRAIVDQRACPGAVSLAHGFGVKSLTQKTAHNVGVNANRLCSATMFNAAGQFANNETIVQVFRA